MFAVEFSNVSKCKYTLQCSGFFCLMSTPGGGAANFTWR